jgi:hypothetical protein
MICEKNCELLIFHTWYDNNKSTMVSSSTNIIEFVWKNEGRNFIRNLEKKIIKIGVEIQNFGPWSNYFENGKSYYESVGILEDKTFSAESNGK